VLPVLHQLITFGRMLTKTLIIMYYNLLELSSNQWVLTVISSNLMRLAIAFIVISVIVMVIIMLIVIVFVVVIITVALFIFIAPLYIKGGISNFAITTTTFTCNH